MKEILHRVNSEKLVMGFISYADDFRSGSLMMMPTMWAETRKSLKEVDIDIGQSKWYYSRRQPTEWEHTILSFDENVVVWGTEAS